MVSGIEDAPSALFKSLFVSKRISYSHPLPFIRDFTLFTVLLSSTETAIRETPVSSIQSWYRSLMASSSLIHGTHQVAQRDTIVTPSLLAIF